MVPLAPSRNRLALAFSLTELMVTVAIIGVFSFVVLGSMAETRRRASTRLAAQELLGFLDAVRRSAMAGALELLGFLNAVRRSAMAGALECRVTFASPTTFNVVEQHTSATAGQLGLDRCARAFSGGAASLNLAQTSASAASLHVVAPASDLLLTPLGTVANTETQTYYLWVEGSSLERCITVLAPVGFVRIGQRNYGGDTNTTPCNYVAGY